MASENIMMDAVKRGGDRQELHERIRVLSMEAGRNVKDRGLANNLIDLIAEDPMFGMTREELTAHLEPERYIGRCPEQVDRVPDHRDPAGAGAVRRRADRWGSGAEGLSFHPVWQFGTMSPAAIAERRN